MNMLLRSSSDICNNGRRLLLGAQLVPEIALIASFSSSSSSSAEIDSLKRRIVRAGDPSVSIVPLLNQWVEEGKEVKQPELRKFIRRLRIHRRPKHALQMLEWMSDQRGYALPEADVAVRLDLISKVHGLEKAEEYFNSIPESARGYKLYGALLNCIAQARQLEKAEAMMQTIRDLGFLKTEISYNPMLYLYSQMGMYEKVDVLMQEMEEKGITCSLLIFNTRLQAYVACSDIEGMEKFLMKMEADPRIKLEFRSYIIAANGYLKAGLVEKTVMMLKRSELLISGKGKCFSYETLLPLYAAVGNKPEVYRIWDLYKKSGKFYNTGCLCMINSLLKLDDMDGAEKIWEEWDSRKIVFDVRIPNLMANAYYKKGFLEKAETCINKIVESGNEPDALSLANLATGYRVRGQMTKSVEMMKKAMSTRKPGWKPRLNTLTKCIEYLKSQGDKEAAEELLKMIDEQ